MQVRPLLLLVCASILAPVFLAAVVAVEKVREGERQAALRGLRETVRATSLLVDGEVQRSMGVLSALGDSPYLRSGDLPSFYKEATRLNQPPNVWTLLLDGTGRQVLNTVVPYGTPPPPAAAQARVRQVLSTQQALVSDLIVGPVTKKLLTTIYLPGATVGSNRYVVAQAFSVDHWKKIALLPQGRSDLTIAVIDRQGRFIARSKKSDELLGKQARPELVAAAAGSFEGLIRHKTLEGTDSYDAFIHSKLTGWTIAVAAPVDSIEASATQAVLWLVAGVGTALALAAGAAVFFGRQFAEAIDAATLAARSLRDGVTPVVPRTSLQEVNTLNESLVHAGHVLAAEKASRESLEAERIQLLANETQARERAQAENAAKDKFLALLGHELRNPLAAINGATEVLLRRAADPAILARYLDMIKRQNRHLIHIVNDLLDVSRMLSGKISLDTRALNLADSVRSCVDAMRTTPQATERCRIEVHADEVWIDGDPTRIEQILNNLLTNALKFSAADGLIKVKVYAPGEHEAVMMLTDTGVGIAPELLPHIFEPFVQGPALKGQVHSGLGIGLALVKQLVELHGGSIQANSDGGGCGSTFILRFPRMQAPLSEASEAGPAATGQDNTTRRRILLVEDNVDAMQATAEVLKLLGFEVTQACDGDQALASIQSSMPDAVLMDIGLPGKNGHQVAADIRGLPHAGSVPLIALTGYGPEGRGPGQSPSCFDDFLIKPVDPALLRRALEAQFSR